MRLSRIDQRQRERESATRAKSKLLVTCTPVRRPSSLAAAPSRRSHLVHFPPFARAAYFLCSAKIPAPVCATRRASPFSARITQLSHARIYSINACTIITVRREPRTKPNGANSKSMRQNHTVAQAPIITPPTVAASAVSKGAEIWKRWTFATAAFPDVTTLAAAAVATV